MELPKRGLDATQPVRSHPGADSGQVDEDERRAIKLRLPMDQVMKLHTLRILQSEPISQVVEAALDDYFARQRAKRAALTDADE